MEGNKHPNPHPPNWWDGPGLTLLFLGSLKPKEPTKITAKLVFVHGYSDHVGRYPELFSHLASNGILVFAWDQRGWGRSVHKPADRGETGPTSVVVADVAAFIEDKLAAAPVGAPLFVMGHSMGGGEVLTLASDATHDALVAKVRGWLLESPFIAFPPAEAPSPIKVFVGKLAGRVLPHFKLYQEVPLEGLSRDPAVVASMRDDKLCHNTGTLQGLAGLLERTDNLDHGRVVLGKHVKSLWLGHGSADRVTSQPRSKVWYERQTALEDGTYKVYDGYFHQLHADIGKEVFFQDVADWILARCGTAAKEALAAETETAETSQPEPAAADETKPDTTGEAKPDVAKL